MEDVKKYLAMIEEELEEPNNLSQDWVQLLTEMRGLLAAKRDGRLVVLGSCEYCCYSDHSHCPPDIDSLECGIECFGCDCGECEGGNKFKAKQDGRLIVLPEKGQKLYWIGSCDCEMCPAKSGCTEMRGLEQCPDYIDAEVWDWDESQGWDEGTQMELFLLGRYLMTWEEALEALKKERALICADCEYWRKPEESGMHRCTCADSEWSGKLVSYGNSCSCLVPRREDRNE